MDDAHVLYSLESIPWLQVGTSVASIKIALRDLRIPSYKERHLCFFFFSFFCQQDQNSPDVCICTKIFRSGQNQKISQSLCSSRIDYSPSKPVLRSIRLCHLSEN